ncbi:MAG: TonB-dependent receptor [Candidatus Cloacimonetes bacterium]|nr:TonB-dependent receptor [Candidatus Cloacimonadota bacterium]
MKKNFFIIGIIMLISININLSAIEIKAGRIFGAITDKDTKAPIAGVNVLIPILEKGISSDAKGHFILRDIPVGSYTVHFQFIGYKPVSKTDVIVKSNRSTALNAELKISPIVIEGITVKNEEYFSETEEQPTSVINFSYEEIRRAPGSGGDVSRIMMGLPCVAKVNDQSNNLVVRGGSPVENAFFIDNIEIPNINHFPTQGSSGGPIGLLNVDFIQDVTFHSGGFSAIYGDRLSSVMDMTFREGNPNEFDGQLDLNFAGFGGIIEGPLFKKRVKYLISARRSYIDFLVDTFELGTDIAPVYGDIQGKLVYEINQKHKLTALTICGDDHSSSTQESAEENQMQYFGNQDTYENTFGINWRMLWNKNGYSNTSFSYTSSKFLQENYEAGTEKLLVENNSLEQSFKLRNVNYFRLNEKHSFEFGIEAKHLIDEYDNFYAEYVDAFGDTVAALVLDDDIASIKSGFFMNYISNPFRRFSATLGIRVDYFSYNENINISPRFSFSCQLTDKTKLNGSAGIFYQNLPCILLSQNEENKNLKDTKAIHYILGLEHLLTKDTKFTLEVYQKDYTNFPLDPTQSNLFLIDELYYRYGYFFNHEQLTDNGEARTRGIEVMLQKKLAEDFYGLVSGTYFRSQYKDSEENWKDRVYDNRYIFSIEGGYKPNYKWEYSLRWIYAGGVPYTPFDREASQQINVGILDDNRINDERYPDYHSLNIRFDRRFYFNRTNLVLYISVWNVYSQKNVATYYWNQFENEQDTIYQWGILPIFGVEYEF